MPKPLENTNNFVYQNFEIQNSTLYCNYSLGEYKFSEKIVIEGDWSQPQAYEAARLIFLLAGISYYKSFAPKIIDLGATPVRPGEVEFLLSYYKGGLGEFSYKNDLSLSNLEIIGGSEAEPAVQYPIPEIQAPLIPFGGGIDSIVTVELVRKTFPEAQLFVMSPGDTKFEALEAAASVTGLEIVRAQRFLDPQILKSSQNGFLNGHVPVTGILSAIALTAAILHGKTAVLMSNERSASEGNLVYDGSMINHQYSKSLEFEDLFRSVLKNSFGQSPDWFSYLRHKNELWIAEKFASFTKYHDVFRSCNRAFHINEADRAKTWCGECDKCCFIDLILSPFISHESLSSMFSGKEPLDNIKLKEVFISLISTDEAFNKPFECVGDISECKEAIKMASKRSDRTGNPLLVSLLEAVESEDIKQSEDTNEFSHNISESYATSDILD